MKLVVTIVGKDRVGIIAMVSNVLAENQVNILMDGFFNMVMIAEMSDTGKMKLPELQKILKEKGAEMGLDIKAQNQEIFNVTHNI